MSTRWNTGLVAALLGALAACSGDGTTAGGAGTGSGGASGEGGAGRGSGGASGKGGAGAGAAAAGAGAAAGTGAGAEATAGAGGTAGTGAAGAGPAAGAPGAGGAAAGAGGFAGGSGVTPIDWATLWVNGFYEGTAKRGVNAYDHSSVPGGYHTAWVGDPGVTLYSNVTDCSSFSDVLMTRAYGWLPPTLHPRPLAEDYYWAVRNGAHFAAVTQASDIQVGDVIAILYGTADGGGDSGHVMWVEAPPGPFVGAPKGPGESALAVTIIDSSHGFHYAPASDTAHQDTRYLGLPPSGGDCVDDAECVAAYGASAICNTWTLGSSRPCAYAGVGRGRVRLYVDGGGKLSGYTWGTNNGSSYTPKPVPAPTFGVAFSGRDLVIGHYVGG